MKAFIVALALAVPLGAAEPAAPVVRASDAPEIADPDLKEAIPAMREGTDEPVGGFREPGMRGKSALVIGVLETGGMQSLGMNYWFNDRWAAITRLGGSYEEPGPGDFRSRFGAAMGLRLLAVPFGKTGHLYVQGAGGLDNARYYLAHRWTAHSTERTVLMNNYFAALGLGAEIFWPGSDRFSIDVTGNLKAKWSFTEQKDHSFYHDPSAGPSSTTLQSGRSFGTSWQNSDILAGFNIYF